MSRERREDFSFSNDSEIYITPIHIRDYFFCPAILYNKYVRGIREPETEMMKDGVERYKSDHVGFKRRKTLLGKKRMKIEKALFSLPLRSRVYRMYGIVDALYWINGRMHVLEIKYSDLRKPFPDHIYQAAAYALMAEEEFGQPAYKIAIYYEKSNYWFEKRLTDQLRRYTATIIKRVWRILSGKEIPEIKWKRKCESCWYLKICHPDRA